MGLPIGVWRVAEKHARLEDETRGGPCIGRNGGRGADHRRQFGHMEEKKKKAPPMAPSAPSTKKRPVPNVAPPASQKREPDAIQSQMRPVPMQKGVAERGDPEIARRTIGQEKLPDLALNFRTARHLGQMIENGALVEEKTEPRRREGVKRDQLQVGLRCKRPCAPHEPAPSPPAGAGRRGNVEDRLADFLAHFGKTFSSRFSSAASRPKSCPDHLGRNARIKQPRTK